MSASSNCPPQGQGRVPSGADPLGRARRQCRRATRKLCSRHSTRAVVLVKDHDAVVGDGIKYSVRISHQGHDAHSPPVEHLARAFGQHADATEHRSNLTIEGG
jgi:hypothetical protein